MSLFLSALIALWTLAGSAPVSAFEIEMWDTRPTEKGAPESYIGRCSDETGPLICVIEEHYGDSYKDNSKIFRVLDAMLPDLRLEVSK